MIGLLKGFRLTFRHLVGPGITTGYPERMPALPERSRGSVEMVFAKDGSPTCRACQLCARECPDNAIAVEVEKPAEGGGRVLTKLTVDMGLCMLCGLCVENCPAGSLTMTPDFEHDTADRSALLRTLYETPIESDAPQD